MAEQWIDAATALRLVAMVHDGLSGAEALCRRLEAGLIHARAKLLVMGEESRSKDAEVIPRIFWLTGGNVELEQNWDTGDFRTWIGDSRWQAFGVTFALSSVLEMLPVEKRATTARRLSVTSNAAWVTARAARQFASDKAGVNPMKAAAVVLDQAELGFVTARAVLAERFDAGRHSRAPSWDRPPDWETREWDIPASYWREFKVGRQGVHDWERGIFSGPGLGPRGQCLMKLSGVHFSTESLQSLLPASAVEGSDETDAAETPARNKGGRPPQPWWDDMWCAVTSLIIHGALVPKRLSEIENAMLTWAAVKGHEISPTAVKPKAKKLFEAYEKEVTNFLDRGL